MANPFRNIVYLQIRRRWLSVRVITWSGGDFRWEGAAEAFLTKDKKGRNQVVGSEIGRANPAPDGRFFTAFAHPRTIVDGYPDTCAVVSWAIRETRYKPGMVKQLFFIHVRDEWEGGLSDVEQRALMEICRECGAASVRFVNAAHELSPPEILQLAKQNRLTHG